MKNKLKKLTLKNKHLKFKKYALMLINFKN